MNKILNGDCLDVLPEIDNCSVNMFLCDLPYGLTACHWDKRLDLNALWVEIKRLLMPKGAVVFTSAQPFTTDLINSNRNWFKYCWVWNKVNRLSGFLNAKKQPLRVIEDILVFYPKQSVFNPVMQTGKGYNVKTCAFSKNYGAQKSTSRFSDGSNYYPSNLINIPGDTKSEGQLNSTQKPVALFEYLIYTYTNPGDLVVDPTAGSMTTAISAINMGRNYVCIEKDPDEYTKGLCRVQAHIHNPIQGDLFSKPMHSSDVDTTFQFSIFDENY